jgi:heptosyltransferase-2
MGAVVRRTLDWATSPAAAKSLAEPVFRLAGRRPRQPVDLTRARRILVVRLDALGDVVLTTPLLRELRRTAPDAWITLVVDPAARNLVEQCPHINELLAYRHDVAGFAARSRQHARAFAFGCLRLGWRGFDWALCPRWGKDVYGATWLLYWSGAPVRAAYAQARFSSPTFPGASLDELLTHPLPGMDRRHEVQHNLDFLGALGGTAKQDHLELWLDQGDEDFAGALLAEAGVERGELMIALGPSARWPWKCWPLARYLELGASLLERFHGRLLVVGGPAEAECGQALRRQLGAGVVNAVGRATLRQSAALLKRCRLFIGNDSAPMHLAAAAGLRVVELCCHAQAGAWSRNSAERFHPWGPPHVALRPRTARPPCRDECVAAAAHCILEITVAEAQAAVGALFFP